MQIGTVVFAGEAAALSSRTGVAQQDDQKTVQIGTVVFTGEADALSSRTGVAQQDDQKTVQVGTVVTKQREAANMTNKACQLEPVTSRTASPWRRRTTIPG